LNLLVTNMLEGMVHFALVVAILLTNPSVL